MEFAFGCVAYALLWVPLAGHALWMWRRSQVVARTCGGAVTHCCSGRYSGGDEVLFEHAAASCCWNMRGHSAILSVARRFKRWRQGVVRICGGGDKVLLDLCCSCPWLRCMTLALLAN